MYNIYFLDATIFDLRVNERIVRDAGNDTDLAVSIDLMNLPRLVVRRRKSARIDENRHVAECGDRLRNLSYNAGRSCHFVAKGTGLVSAIMREPLKIGVYRVGERFPLCASVAPLAGCVCDMITETIEKSCLEYGGTFELTDPGDNPAGHVVLKLALTNLGRHVTTLYALDRDAFLLKNRQDGSEYKCTRTIDSDYANNSVIATNDLCTAELMSENLMQKIAGISLVARDLSSGRREEKRERQRLEIHHGVMDDEITKVDTVEAKKSKKKSNKKNKKK